jgi:hypothetical protein
MNQFTSKFDVTSGSTNGAGLPARSFIDPLANLLVRFGILHENLDCHLIRASMVIMFLFFGYQKWFQYEADVVGSLYQQRPAYFLAVPGFRHPGSHLVLGSLRVVVWRAFVVGFLE